MHKHLEYVICFLNTQNFEKKTQAYVRSAEANQKNKFRAEVGLNLSKRDYKCAKISISDGISVICTVLPLLSACEHPLTVTITGL